MTSGGQIGLNDHMLHWFLGGTILVFTIVYLFFASLTIKHAARFRYLSKRTVYLTIFFVILSAILFAFVYTLFSILFF